MTVSLIRNNSIQTEITASKSVIAQLKRQIARSHGAYRDHLYAQLDNETDRLNWLVRKTNNRRVALV